MLDRPDAPVFCTRAHTDWAAHILEHSFGPVVTKVGKQLLKQGAMSLSELARELELPATKLRNSLLVLIQHNIVRVTERHVPAPGKSVAPPPTVQYEAVLDEVLVRPWFPRMAVHMRAMLGHDEELLVHELLVHGRLSSDELVQRATESYATARAQPIESDEVEGKRLAFVQAASVLRERRYMTPSETLPSALMPEAGGGAVGGASGRNTPHGNGNGNSGAFVGAASAAGADSGNRKRKAPASASAAAPGAVVKGGAGKASKASKTGGGGGKSPAPSAAGGRGSPGWAPIVGLVGSSGGGSSAPLPPAVLWRANLPRLLWDFKHEAIKRMIGDKLDANAAGLINVCLYLQRALHPYLDDNHVREPFTVEDVLQRCPQTLEEDGPLITRPLVLNYLDAMCSDPLCRIASTLNGKYILELTELLNAVKQLLLEGVVKSKVGDDGARLYRLLLRKHARGGCAAKGQQKMEFKMLAELALLPDREVRPQIWALLHAGYVSLQEVSRAADHNPKATTYLWYVSLPHAYRTLEEEMVGSLVRMHQRLVVEQANADRLARVTRPSNLGDASGKQLRDAAVARARAESLELAILRLSDTALLVRTL